MSRGQRKRSRWKSLSPGSARSRWRSPSRGQTTRCRGRLSPSRARSRWTTSPGRSGRGQRIRRSHGLLSPGRARSPWRRRRSHGRGRRSNGVTGCGQASAGRRMSPGRKSCGLARSPGWASRCPWSRCPPSGAGARSGAALRRPWATRRAAPTSPATWETRCRALTMGAPAPATRVAATAPSAPPRTWTSPAARGPSAGTA
mmetsp:Transcript_14458/g.45197  ORF Transcript_14458/g.45197 Transcript_14458/m.45197 type:complete len:201 (+) Transcript_14458:1062-1664(+)